MKKSLLCGRSRELCLPGNGFFLSPTSFSSSNRISVAPLRNPPPHPQPTGNKERKKSPIAMKTSHVVRTQASLVAGKQISCFFCLFPFLATLVWWLALVAVATHSKQVPHSRPHFDCVEETKRNGSNQRLSRRRRVIFVYFPRLLFGTFSSSISF